jgi:1-phosphatidylinositol-3-phosphate 5-kinase
MKNTLAAPISSAVAAASGGSTNASSNTTGNASEPRRLSYSIQNSQSSLSSRASALERPIPLSAAPSNPAPPLISLTPVVSEAPSYTSEYQDDRSPSLGGSFYTPVYEAPDGGHFGTAIPGFPIQDDARSVRTTASLHKSGSVSKVIRRIRGEGGYLSDAHVTPYTLCIVCRLIKRLLDGRRELQGVL